MKRRLERIDESIARFSPSLRPRSDSAELYMLPMGYREGRRTPTERANMRGTRT